MGSYMGKEREKSMGMSSIGKEYITELGTESPSRLYHPVLPGVHGERGGGVTMVYQVRTLGHAAVAYSGCPQRKKVGRAFMGSGFDLVSPYPASLRRCFLNTEKHLQGAGGLVELHYST